jgi:AraC-like DNA-binding protein
MMQSIGLDTGIGITMETDDAVQPAQSYFEISSDPHFLRVELHVSPQDFLFPVASYSKLFITYTDPVWSHVNHNALLNKARPIAGVRYYLPCDMQKSIWDIMQLDRNDILSEMKLTSLALEALVSAFESIEKIQVSCNSCQVLQDQPSGGDFLEKAMKIIQTRFHERITIPEIAREIGTNQCYLKKGFKLQYGDTIFGAITRLRMLKASEIIRIDASRKLAEIAEAVGYSSLSSFSAAFKQYHGYSPQDLKK